MSMPYRHGCGAVMARCKAIEQRRSPEPGPDVWLVFAPIKRARLEWLVEKATELGVAALVPVMTARTQSERVNRERLRVIAVAASEQSERMSLPEIRPEVPLTRLLADWPADRRLILCDESGAGQPMAEALAGFDGTAPAAVFVGPEGGFRRRSLTLSVNSPLLRESGSARGYCAPRPPPLPRWRFIRRSPATGGSSVGAERRKFIIIGGFGSRMSGPSSLQGPPITDKRQLIEYHEAAASRRARGASAPNTKNSSSAAPI